MFNVQELSLLLVKDANERFSKADQEVYNLDTQENGFIKQDFEVFPIAIFKLTNNIINTNYYPEILNNDK